MAEDFGKKELAERRRELRKRVRALATKLEEQRKLDEVVTSAQNSRNRSDEAKYPAMASRRR